MEVTSHNGQFTIGKECWLSIEQEEGWAPELIWIVLEMGKYLEDPHKGKNEVRHLFLQIQASEKPDTGLS